MSSRSSFITAQDRYIVQTVPVLNKARTPVPLKPAFIAAAETRANQRAPVHR